MTRVALSSNVFAETDTQRALGLLLVCFVSPVLVGEFPSGALPNPCDRWMVMLSEALALVEVVARIPPLDTLGVRGPVVLTTTAIAAAGLSGSRARRLHVAG